MYGDLLVSDHDPCRQKPTAASGESRPLPLYLRRVLTGLTLAASGSSWDDAAAAVGLKAATLRRWHRTDSRCQEFIETVVRESINTANNVLINALPRLADELITMAMDKSVKPYSRIAAISEGVQDREHQRAGSRAKAAATGDQTASGQP